MRRKSLGLLLIAVIFPLLSYSQNFSLIEPNIKELKADLGKSDFVEDIFYLYLTRNYKVESEKFEIKNFEYPDYGICSFKQSFHFGISYYSYKCDEAGGLTTELTLPKIDVADLKNWIEKIYYADLTEIPNEWYEDGVTYGPIDREVGCYYQIMLENESWIVSAYCGC
ncbi:hypothetical protein [Algoriphagus yeomjeoni]|uniref:Uncharacterized protein n=1 Tax=Algoriphagus yeomjeoni TaxID=291403 RepID=A0A327NXH4_9BACT|nr:hypothetical protein [Algoriphagus yeomjeoni]RAI84690.1 hypothetical protein LV83_03947 [Algoriphagus yeomjeoni]